MDDHGRTLLLDEPLRSRCRRLWDDNGNGDGKLTPGIGDRNPRITTRRRNEPPLPLTGILLANRAIPRSLNEPDGCSASYFNQTVLPLRMLSGLDCSRGDAMWSGI